MTTLLQQLAAYQYDSEKLLTGGEDSNSSSLQQQQQYQEHIRDNKLQQQQQQYQEYIRDNKLQQHEREQHLHQLQSINNLLLEMPPPLSPSSSFGGSMASPTKTTATGLEDMSITELFGLGLPRGSLMGDGQKQSGQSNCDTNGGNRDYLHRRSDTSGYAHSSSGYYLNSTSHKQYSSMEAFYQSTEVPSSPISVHAPTSPSTPESVYSNAYSYSSVASSPYTSSSSPESPGYSKQLNLSPVRRCYGRPIRGNSTPYSDCPSSPSVEFPSHVYNCNGTRSNSPADSDNSVSSFDGHVSEAMNTMTLTHGQHRCYPSVSQNSMMDANKYIQNGRGSMDAQRYTKYLNVPTPMHHFHHHAHDHSRNQDCNHQYSGNCTNMCSSEKNCCMGNKRNVNLNTLPNSLPQTLSLDKAARCHRNAAAGSDATYTWRGDLPQRTQKPVAYSSKVFLGGVPWDITEAALISTFKQFGSIKIEWPGKNQTPVQPKGYAYIIFESEKQVKNLLANCTHDFSNGGSYYYKISSKRMKGKAVQVIPWSINDSNYVKSTQQKLDAEKTVFVGALHGMITATGLASIMNDLFDNVIYAGIDTDKFKYPIGSARVTFSSKQSYNKAVNAAFIEVKTAKFAKIIQVDPYIEDAPCSSCFVQQGPYFCRERICFKYYCHTCWNWNHNNSSMSWHKPMSRGLKNNQVIGLSPSTIGRFTRPPYFI
ncbi:translational regulator orb2 isoform X2 [Phymastichus coffea]|uniref:translational regulator orb2 isoform X2 n=1 Tax=Phymastichus coffea TaxID=108790 RepID=UPI00273C8EFF|nr:translational regulator orb2 isoform X2 [Phymastichus coffea]